MTGILVNRISDLMYKFTLPGNLKHCQFLPQIETSQIMHCDWKPTICLPKLCTNTYMPGSKKHRATVQEVERLDMTYNNIQPSSLHCHGWTELRRQYFNRFTISFTAEG